MPPTRATLSIRVTASAAEAVRTLRQIEGAYGSLARGAAREVTLTQRQAITLAVQEERVRTQVARTVTQETRTRGELARAILSENRAREVALRTARQQARAEQQARSGGRRFADVVSAGVVGGLARGGLVAGTVAAGGEVARRTIGRGIDLAGGLEEALNVLQQQASASDSQLEQLRKTARELGEDAKLPATSSLDAARAMLEMSRAGVSLKDTMDGARGTLQLATAANVDAAEAAKVTSNALNAFELAGTEATHVADLLAAAAMNSSAEIPEIADALQQSAAVAHTAGISIEDLTASIAQMSKAGINGSDAGTSLKSAILALQTPTDKARQIMESLGIEIYDATTKRMKPWRQVIDEVSRATVGLTQEQRDFALGTIFGSDAVRAANIVLAAGVDRFDETRRATDRAGAAAETAEARTKGYRGAVEALQSQIDTILENRATPFLKFLTDGARNANEAAGEMDTLADKIGRLWEAMKPRGEDAERFLGILRAAYELSGLGTGQRLGREVIGRALGFINEAGSRPEVAYQQDHTGRVAILRSQRAALEDRRHIMEHGSLRGRNIGMRQPFTDAEMRQALQAHGLTMESTRQQIDAAIRRIGTRITGGGARTGRGQRIAGQTLANGSTLNFSGDFGERLQEFLDASGGRVSVFSGTRSERRQRELWEAALRRYGSPAAARRWVAPPGRSNHNRGLAADLRFTDAAARRWAHQNAAQFGLHFPMGHEPWHIEPVGARSKKPNAALAALMAGENPEKDAERARKKAEAEAKRREAEAKRHAERLAAVEKEAARDRFAITHDEFEIEARQRREEHQERVKAGMDEKKSAEILAGQIAKIREQRRKHYAQIKRERIQEAAEEARTSIEAISQTVKARIAGTEREREAEEERMAFRHEVGEISLREYLDFLNKQIAGEEKYTRRYMELVRQRDAAAKTQFEGAQAEVTASSGEEAFEGAVADVEGFRREIDPIGQEIEGIFRDSFRGALAHGENFFDSLLQGFRGMLADMLAEAAARKVAGGILGALGLGKGGGLFEKGPAGGMGGAGGLGGILGFAVGGPVGAIAGGLLGGLFADGGSPPVGRLSLVGERGPELFLPRIPGTIIPNHQLPALAAAGAAGRGGAGKTVYLTNNIQVGEINDRADADRLFGQFTDDLDRMLWRE